MKLTGSTKLDLSGLPTTTGVYVVCDLDETPLYVGQATSIRERGINGRVRRHVTSARADSIANRQVDVWEIAYIWVFTVVGKAEIEERERQVFHLLDAKVGLVAGHKRPPAQALLELPKYDRAVLLDDEEIARRRELRFRLPRQVRQIGELLDVMVTIKDTAPLRRSLAAHLKRLDQLYAQFISAKAPEQEDSEEAD